MCFLNSVIPLLFFSFSGNQAAFTQIDDSVLFKIDWKSHSSLPDHLSDAENEKYGNHKVVHMHSSENETYICSIPDILSKSKLNAQEYAGPSPSELIQPLYDEKLCSYWLDIYWTYELCHGRYVLQYHDGKDIGRNTRMEYYLGNFQREKTKLDDKNFNEKNPPTRKIDNKIVPYYQVNYVQGTVCDLTGKPRKTIVIYVCKQDAKDHIFSILEISSCTYEMIVVTKRLCLHPSFSLVSQPDYEITCYSMNSSKKEAKPNSLLLIEHEMRESREQEYSIDQSKDSSPVSKGVIFQMIGDSYHEKLSDLKEFAVDKSEFEKESFDDVHKSSTHISQENLYFLNGDHCLYGGESTWWKYEFCFGKSVIQFHEDGSRHRVEVVLGVFNEEIHKKWIEDHPKKRPVKIDGKIVQVHHFYTGGDPCEETNDVRSVEVRIRCRPSKISGSSVVLYLLEPYTCRYILAVESSTFCGFLQAADDNGIIQVDKTKKEKVDDL